MKKKKSKLRKRKSASRRGPFFAGHPLNSVPFELRQRIAAEHGRRQCEKFEAVLPEIVELVSRIDPLHTLALMSMYGLMASPNQQGNHKRPTWTPKVQQGHVEFLQALCLRNRLELSTEFPEPPSIQMLFDRLPELFGAYQEMRVRTPVAGAESSSKHEAGVIPVQEFIRAHTSVVRNWGYFGSVTRIARELLSRIDDDYERLAGMKLSKIVDIQSVPAMLADAGVLKNKYPLAPCMSLADLEVMLDLLETTYLRLHYLRRRAELLMSLHTIGDELDMLGIYLDTAMNLGTMQGKDNTIIISGYSAKIDRYYSLRDESLPSKKPQPNTSQWFKRLCAQLEERAHPGWSEIACALLSIAPIDQTKFERHVRTLAAKVKAGKPLKDDQDTMVLIPPEWNNQALAFQVKRRYSPRPYSSHSQNIAQQAFDSEHVKRCVVLVVDATDINLSYLSAAMFTEGETSHAVFY